MPPTKIEFVDGVIIRTANTTGNGAVTLTVTVLFADPPEPVQVRVKVEFEVRLPVDCEPEIEFIPDQAPEATHEVALDEDQVRVETDPEVTEVGFAKRATVGAAGGSAGEATEKEITKSEALTLPAISRHLT